MTKPSVAKAKTTTEQIQFVKYVVFRYLRDKPELHHLANDLIQEGYLGLLDGLTKYDPSKGYAEDKSLYLYHYTANAVRNCVAKESRHYTSNYEEWKDYEGQHWNLTESVNIEDMPTERSEEQIPSPELQLKLILEGLSLTDRQYEIMEAYLESGCQTTAARKLGISAQHIQATVRRVTELAQDYIQYNKD